jgi:hypothetical protein
MWKVKFDEVQQINDEKEYKTMRSSSGSLKIYESER